MKGSAINWCDSTFNGWEGCTHVSPGCDNCYAETRDGRHARGTKHHLARADKDHKPHRVLARSRQQCCQRPVCSRPAIECAKSEESRPAADRERTVSRDHRRRGR